MLNKLSLFKAGLASRSTVPFSESYVQDKPGPLDRDEYDVRLEELYNLNEQCNAVRKSVQALRDTILMNGYEWEPKFSRKCKVCREEFPADEKPDWCKECGAHTAEEDQAPPGPQPMQGAPQEAPMGQQPPGGQQPPQPDGEGEQPQPEPGEAPPPKQQEQPVETSVGVRFPPDVEWYEEPDEREIDAFDDFFKKVDRNGHSFIESLKIYEDHLNVADDAFMIHLADYELGAPGDGIEDWSTRELYVADPRNFKMVVHPRLRTPGGRWWICLSGDTEIPLLDGSEKTIRELHEEGAEDFWAYGCTEDGSIVPTQIDRAVLTKCDAELVEVTLDNDKSIKCTPDHEFMLRDGTYREAQDLEPGDSLMPLYRKEAGMPGTDSEYESVKHPEGGWQYTHRAVADALNLRKGEGDCLHHENFDPLDNRPGNLEWMTWGEHCQVHTEAALNATGYWETEEGKEECRRHAKELNKKWETGEWPGQQLEVVNHKVASVDPAPNEDVYDLVNSDTENFATSAGVFAHNCLQHRPRPDISYLGDVPGEQEEFQTGRSGQDDVYEAPSAEGIQTGSLSEGGRVYEEPGTCDECGRELHEVWWVAVEPGTGGSATGGAHGAGAGSEEILEYYVGPDSESGFPGEVIHESKYSPDYGYGKAPLTSVYNMARTLIEQERFMRTFYEEERMPRSALFIPTRNPDGVQSLWQSAEDRNVSQDGHYVPKFTFDPGESSSMPQYMEFSRLPEEMQFEQVRDEFYRRIGSAFGVAPVFHGNVDAVGLQNQGPTQWQVTLLAAKRGQTLYNEEIFPKMMDLMRLECSECGEHQGGFSEQSQLPGGGVGCDLCGGDGKVTLTDWELQLAPVELEDDMQELQKEMMRVQRAMSMQQVGFPPLGRDPVTGEFEFPVEPQEMEQQGMGGGGMGGMMGGPPGQPPSQQGQGGQGGGFGPGGGGGPQGGRQR